MVQLTLSVHHRGLHPLQAARAWHLHREEGMSLNSIRDEVVSMIGERPSKKLVWSAVRQMDVSEKTGTIVGAKYANCGRKQLLTPEQQEAVVAFMKRWRKKRFCTCQYIAQALKLKVDRKTIANVLVRHGFRWKRLPQIRGLSPKDLERRKAFVNKHLQKSPGWWQENIGLVLDGVTLTKAPKVLSDKQRHMAQSIKSMWVLDGEQHDNNLHNYNRYGVQLGVKVPLWGGFTGGGSFTLREWTPRAKMTKADWVERLPAVKRAADTTEAGCRAVRAKVWQDNERFLTQPVAYKAHGLQLQSFPTNSGDLNPIETVWAWLRRDLAKREQCDFAAGRDLTIQQFRQRAAQILQGYGYKRPGEEYSPLAKLVRGMPKRLLKCKDRQLKVMAVGIHVCPFAAGWRPSSRLTRTF